MLKEEQFGLESHCRVYSEETEVKTDQKIMANTINHDETMDDLIGCELGDLGAVNRGQEVYQVTSENDGGCILFHTCGLTEETKKSKIRESRARKNFNYRSSAIIQSGFLLLVLILILGASRCDGFNLDVANNIAFESIDTGSYYGYTVAMLRRNANTKWLLLGAPKGRSKFLPDADKPGAIHKCDLSQDVFESSHCDEIQIDDKGAEDTTDFAKFDGLTRTFKNGRDNQWLGASLDVHPDKGIVTCASRWFNRLFENYYFMNGFCYEVPLDFDPKNIRRIPAMINGSQQTLDFGDKAIYKYGQANLGVSAHFSKTGNDVLFGAPGMWSWSGGFVAMTPTGNYITEHDAMPTDISEMGGYAVTSGNYFGNGQTLFAIGSPRDNLTGKVHIYQGEMQRFIMEKPFLTLDGSENGDQDSIPINGFFGAGLWTVDVNNDGKDDLLVGAPMYSKGENPDTGAVLVYLGQSDFKLKLMEDYLWGNKASGARFGTAMSSLGDINLDGYNDIIIGAPYEDDNQGAVYVYNGCKTGVWPVPSQRIPAANMKAGTLGFGISFSKPQDMNDDKVNDIAIGAYLSDSAFLMFGQSVITMNMTINMGVAQIDPYPQTISPNLCLASNGVSKVPCFNLDICFNYLYSRISMITLNVTAVLDTYLGEYNRIAWQNGGLANMNMELSVFSGQRICIGYQNVIVKTLADLVTPVRIVATYSVTSFNTAVRPQPKINEFNGNTPDKKLTVATKIVEFKKDCPNNICNTDLKVHAIAKYIKHDDYFIVGNPDLDIEISIIKTGDPSYTSNLFITFPKSVQYQQVQQVSGETDVTCGFLEEREETEGVDDVNSLEYLQRQLVPPKGEDENMVVCAFGNPLKNDTGVKFVLKMVVPETVSDSNLKFTLNATTLSTELAPADNVQEIDIQLKNKVTTNFKGVSRPAYMTIVDKEDTTEISHIYELRNQGPSPLPKADLTIEFPQVQIGGEVYLQLNVTRWSCVPPCSITCKFPDKDNTAPYVYASSSGPSYTLDGGNVNIGQAQALSELRNVNCEKSACSRYDCVLKNIPPRESAVVTLEMIVKNKIIDAINDGNAVTIGSEGIVSLKALDRIMTDDNFHFTYVNTEMLPEKVPAEPIAWWIYLLSALGGLLLIAIVVLLLWKCGFFRRKQREEMEKMQHIGEVEKMVADEEG